MSEATQQDNSLTPDKLNWALAFVGLDAKAASPPANVPGAAAGAPGGPPQTETLPKGMSATDMKDEDIAAEIMDKQVAIIVGWQTALQVFDKVMTSSADAEATPDFQKTVVGYFSDKLLGAMINHTPGASELDALVKALSAEVARATAAGASAKLRDFVVQHAQAIGALEQSVLAQRQGFISAVRARREAIEAPRQASTGRGRGHKGGMVEPTKDDDDYGMMRMALLDTLGRVDATLKGSNSQALFRVLSEEWMRAAKVTGGMGIKFDARVIIRLNPNYSIMDAHIQGAGGQKLAEQLLKDNPDGVDVFNLKTVREIKLMAENGWPSAILSLDANNHDISSGSFIEGNSDALRKVVMSKGLGRTKKLDGD